MNNDPTGTITEAKQQPSMTVDHDSRAQAWSKMLEEIEADCANGYGQIIEIIRPQVDRIAAECVPNYSPDHPARDAILAAEMAIFYTIPADWPEMEPYEIEGELDDTTRTIAAHVIGPGPSLCPQFVERLEAELPIRARMILASMDKSRQFRGRETDRYLYVPILEGYRFLVTESGYDESTKKKFWKEIERLGPIFKQRKAFTDSERDGIAGKLAGCYQGAGLGVTALEGATLNDEGRRELFRLRRIRDVLLPFMQKEVIGGILGNIRKSIGIEKTYFHTKTTYKNSSGRKSSGERKKKEYQGTEEEFLEDFGGNALDDPDDFQVDILGETVSTKRRQTGPASKRKLPKAKTPETELRETTLLDATLMAAVVECLNRYDRERDGYFFAWLRRKIWEKVVKELPGTNAESPFGNFGDTSSKEGSDIEGTGGGMDLCEAGLLRQKSEKEGVQTGHDGGRLAELEDMGMFAYGGLSADEQRRWEVIGLIDELDDEEDRRVLHKRLEGEKLTDTERKQVERAIPKLKRIAQPKLDGLRRRDYS